MSQDSTKGFKEIGDQGVEISILLSEFLHLLDRMNDRRMVLSSETPPDFWERCVGQRLAQIHRYLAGHSD
jgi:hypothetical protein